MMYHYRPTKKFQIASGYEFRLFDIGNDILGRNSKSENPLKPVVSDVTYINNAVFSEASYELNKSPQV